MKSAAGRIALSDSFDSDDLAQLVGHRRRASRSFHVDYAVEVRRQTFGHVLQFQLPLVA